MQNFAHTQLSPMRIRIHDQIQDYVYRTREKLNSCFTVNGLRIVCLPNSLKVCLSAIRCLFTSLTHSVELHRLQVTDRPPEALWASETDLSSQPRKAQQTHFRGAPSLALPALQAPAYLSGTSTNDPIRESSSPAYRSSEQPRKRPRVTMADSDDEGAEGWSEVEDSRQRDEKHKEMDEMDDVVMTSFGYKGDRGQSLSLLQSPTSTDTPAQSSLRNVHSALLSAPLRPPPACQLTIYDVAPGLATPPVRQQLTGAPENGGCGTSSSTPLAERNREACLRHGLPTSTPSVATVPFKGQLPPPRPGADRSK